MSTPTRRTLLRAAAWAAPAVTVIVAVPAYAATSDTTTCNPTGRKHPGDGQHGKDYALTLNCTGHATAIQVLIDGQQATETSPGVWTLAGQPDSEAKLIVQVIFTTGTWSGLVQFKPTLR